MRPDDRTLAIILAQNKIQNGMMFKMDFDPRIIGNKIVDGKQITGIGEKIRSTSLDEFPQSWSTQFKQNRFYSVKKMSWKSTAFGEK